MWVFGSGAGRDRSSIPLTIAGDISTSEDGFHKNRIRNTFALWIFSQKQDKEHLKLCFYVSIMTTAVFVVLYAFEYLHCYVTVVTFILLTTVTYHSSFSVAPPVQ